MYRLRHRIPMTSSDQILHDLADVVGKKIYRKVIKNPKHHLYTSYDCHAIDRDDRGYAIYQVELSPKESPETLRLAASLIEFELCPPGEVVIPEQWNNDYMSHLLIHLPIPTEFYRIAIVTMGRIESFLNSLSKYPIVIANVDYYHTRRSQIHKLMIDVAVDNLGDLPAFIDHPYFVLDEEWTLDNGDSRWLKIHSRYKYDYLYRCEFKYLPGGKKARE